MASQAWKHHEREVAKYFATQRRLRGGDFSQSDVEVLAPVSQWLQDDTQPGMVLVECKYSSTNQLPVKFRKACEGVEDGKIPVVRYGDYLLCYLEDFEAVYLDMIVSEISDEYLAQNFSLLRINGRHPKYLADFREQANDYAEDIRDRDAILAVSCIAKRHTSGRIIAILSDDLAEYREAIRSIVSRDTDVKAREKEEDEDREDKALL